MIRLLPLCLGALLLGACTPAFNAAYRSGRVVNVTTGQEGRLVLGGAGTVSGRGPASIEFGDDVYRGEYNVLSAAGELTLSGGASFGFGDRSALGFFGDFGPRPRAEAPLRNGNLIVRNARGAVITCDFAVDRFDRGNGNCTDGAGARYSFQF